MRLIDADALIADNKLLGRDCIGCVADGCTECLFDNFCRMIRNAPTVSGWISVKDRMPEIGKTVLVLSKYGHVSDVILREFSGGKLLFVPYGFAPGKDVTHWMPLPEPPKDERGGEQEQPCKSCQEWDCNGCEWRKRMGGR